MNMAGFRLRGFLVLLVVAVLLSGCGGNQGGAALDVTGLQVAESGVKWAPSPSPSPTPVPTFSLVLSKGWNAFTFPLATSKKVSEITMTCGGQIKS